MLFLADRLGENILEGRNARSKVPDLDTELRGLDEDGLLIAGAAVRIRQTGRHEDPHHVLVRRVAVHAGLSEDFEEPPEIAFDPQLEDATRGTLQLRDRPLRRDLSLVHHDDM